MVSIQKRVSICFTISGNGKYQRCHWVLFALCMAPESSGTRALERVGVGNCVHIHIGTVVFVLHGDTQKEKAFHGVILFHPSEITKVTPSCPNFMPAWSYLSLLPPNRYFCFGNASGIAYDLDHGSKACLEDPSEPCKDSRCKKAALNPSLI